MEVQEVVTMVIQVLIIPAVALIGAEVHKYIKSKIKHESLEKYVLLATDCISDSVAQVAQQYVDKLSSEEWNETTKLEAFEQARATALENLGVTGKLIIEEAIGDFDGWVKTKIEAEVKKLAHKEVK